MGDDLVVGGQLGSYLIESVIGRGGMSVVYRARHARLGTSVALKVLAPELSSDDTFRERFLHEAQMAAGIDHPNVIPIHDMGLHDGSLYIVMRYVAGGDLKALLATSAPLDPEQAIAILMPVAQALDAAHESALVHRDVKPGNILLQRSVEGEVEHVYLSDFGIAKSVASVSGLTRAGGVLGTVDYMAPEQAHGADVSAATDEYALAGVFYQCITGRTPFERERLRGAWPPPDSALEPVSALRPGLAPALDAVLARALANDPRERYGSCVQLLDACRQALAPGKAATAPGKAATAPGKAASAPGPPESAARVPAAGAGLETVALEPAAPGAAPASPGQPPSAPEPWPPVSAPATSQPSALAPQAATPPAGASDAGRSTPATRGRRRGLAAVLGAVALAVVVAAVILATSSSNGKSGGVPSSATLGQVPTNHVTGSGSATLRLKGDVATVTVTTTGLDYDEPLTHALHIHTGGKGICPPASAAKLHNGHLSISTTDGIDYYGPPAVALTTHGDTSPSSILVFSRYPTGGVIHYSRTFEVPASVVTRIRENNAVIVVHGTDYDHSGIYSGVLERSELNRAVPATATAPALCGTLIQSKTTASASPRRATQVYTASLGINPLAGLLCEASEGITLQERRRARAGAQPQTRGYSGSDRA